MKRINKKLLTTIVFLLAACGDKNHTVEDFIKSNTLRAEFQKKCEKDNSSNCNNLFSAQNIIEQAEKGSTKKQFLIGDLYFSDHNYKEAIHWFTKAADSDNSEAIDRLGQIMYLIGSKKPLTKEDEDTLTYLEKKLNDYKKPDSVARYYLRQLSNGDTEALISLGIIYRKGTGVEKDYDAAISYFKRYTETKDVTTPGWGEYYLAYMYLEGEGFEKSEKHAIRLLEKSCNLRFKESCYKLGELFFLGGNEFRPDYKKATELLDVYSGEKDIDSRAISYANHLFEIYEKGGFGINKNTQRVQQLKEIVCPSYGYLLKACTEK